MPPLAALLIGFCGWRDALSILALLGMAVSLPTFFWLAVDRPALIGQLPEGGDRSGAVSASTESASKEPIARPISTLELLRRTDFWAIAAMFGLLLSSGLVSITYTVPYAEQFGLSLQGGAWILAARSLSAFAGQIGLGWLSDRVGRRPVLFGAIGIEFVGWFGIAYAPNVWAFVLAGIVVGFVSGSFGVLRGSLLAAVYGRRDFSTVSGLLVPASLPFQVMAVPLAGYIFDLTGDYASAFRSFLFVFPVAALLLLLIPEGQTEALPLDGSAASR